MKTKLNILMILALAAALIGGNTGVAQAAIPLYAVQGSVNIAPATATLTAVDPLVYIKGTDVVPARPFLYSVDSTGITITRFNDNAVVSQYPVTDAEGKPTGEILGTWPWPDELWITLPDGGQMAIPKPLGGWEPVAMTVSAPTDAEMANRAKDIPDLTPPFTFVYVVMARSGYEWDSSNGSVRDMIVPSTNPATESSVLVQIDVSDPSFSTSIDPAAPTEPHIAGAILGHEAGQPVYDRKTGNVYVGNQEFVSVIARIPDTVAAEEREIPGIGQPVIRCGPQHPETGIPVGRPQAYACYDPGAKHPINDNEHVGGYGEIKQWDETNPDLLQEQYVWEFRNLPDWLTPHYDLVSGEYDGILYGTPPTTGDWVAEARVHDLADEYGIFSDWHPIFLSVRPTAEYLPIKAQFAAGVPVSYQLEGTGSCTLNGAPAWVDIQPVPNGCAIMGRAPTSGEYYEFTMPDFRETGYPNIPIVFSGNVVGGYSFVPLSAGVGISGMAWHQVEKYADPSTETPVLSGEFIGVDPSSGQMYQILQAPGRPQPLNERPAETALAIDMVYPEGDLLSGSGFGEVAVEADRDIYVAAANAVIKVSGGKATSIPLDFTPSSLSLDSDLRTAILGVEPGQVDHGILWAAGAGKVAVIDTDLATVAQSFDVPGASYVSADFGAQWAYAATGSSNVAIFGPAGSTRPLMEPRIWSSEELNFNQTYPGAFRVMATGDPLPTLDLFGELPLGLTYVDKGNGFAWVSGTPDITAGGDGYAYNITVSNSVGVYAQAFGITVYGPAVFTTLDTATFTAGSASSFTVSATAPTAPIMYTWAEEPVMAPGVELVDHEDGTAGVQGTPTLPGTYHFLIGANTGFLTDADDAAQLFTLVVNPEGTPLAPTITSGNTALFESIGAPFSPDQVTITSIGSPTPTLSIVIKEGQTGLPAGVNFIDNGDSTGALGSGCAVTWPGMAPECLALLPPEAAEGTYTFTIRAENANGFAEQEFTLDLEVATSIMTPPPEAPANLSFAYTPGGPLPLTQIFSVGTLGDTMPYAAVTTTRWLSVSPESGTIPSGLTVSVDPMGLAPGSYTGSVLITSAATEGPFAVALVTLTVVDTSAPGVLGTFPSALSFQYNVNGGTLLPAQSILVMSGGVPLNYTVSTGDAKWLSASASGRAPAIFNVSVDPRVGVGMHIANLTLTSEDGKQNLIIPVTLLKTAGDRALIQVMFDVGSGPEGIAANLTTHNLFITSSNAAAEAAEAGGATVPEVELPGPPEPALVFHINPLDKSLVSQVVMHGEAEYIGVNSKTGTAYQASQATGELAVINGSTNKVITYIDLTLAGVPHSPYQVAIDEAQNFIYVGTKSPEPEPYALIPDASGKYGCKVIRELPSDEAPAGQEELDCWHPGRVFVIDGNTNTVIGSFLAGDDPEGVVFAKATGKVYASNEDDGNITVAQGAKRTNGTITPAKVLGTIIKGNFVPATKVNDTFVGWQPTCDANNYCGTKENLKVWLWPQVSACHGIDDEAEEADKMAVDPAGNIYIIDDRYRVAKINGATGAVVEVIPIPGYDCERTVSDDSPVLLRNTANNIAYMASGQGKLYVTSEQNTLTLIEWIKNGKKILTKLTTLTLPKAAELDAITTDPALNQVYITDENLASMWILKGACANGVGNTCTP
jgi:DNA-binding beta-propeller fold protein YncE